ncbi:coiled-coil domain-containing protein 96 [Gracilinanus agilis]|uniref:coiled-coil domain-containing protein 96 n=1 Tax=Gracilinanus agilis TaxID=191870 RepID=UPI001CFDAC28|nr:coiled-coil domain-containing protein 96 [Gracilinanus agilis]
MEVIQESEEGQVSSETTEPIVVEAPDGSQGDGSGGGGPSASIVEPSEGGEPTEAAEPGGMEEAEEEEEAEEAQEGEEAQEAQEAEATEEEGKEEMEQEAEAEEEEEMMTSTFSEAEEMEGEVSESVEVPSEVSREDVVEETRSPVRLTLTTDKGSDVSFEMREEEEEKEEEEEYEPEEQAISEEAQLKLQEQQLRGELLEQYRGLISERNRIRQYNMHLQHKIALALRKKKGGVETEVAEKTPGELDTPEKEQTYQRYLSSLEELKKQHSEDMEWYQRELEQLQRHCQEKLAKVEKEWKSFQNHKKQVILQAMGTCSLPGGKQAALREVEQIQDVEDRKEKEMSIVRLENVQLKQSLAHLEARMKAQEELTEGLHLIDFEQLKIENQTFNEKVEERKEELIKLHYKVSSNVQIITHVKEKLQFVELENMGLKSELMEIDAQVAQKRDILTKTKKARDSLRIDNVKLNQKCGLLGKEMLLRDLEQKVDQTELLSQRLETLKRQYAGLTLSCKGLKQKIKESKAFLPS